MASDRDAELATVDEIIAAVTDPVSLARIEKLRAVGRRVAQYLRDNPKAFQVQAAVACGLTEKTYYAWLAGEKPAELAFQREVNPAIHEHAQAMLEEAEQAVGCTEQGSGAWANWMKWKLEKSHRKIFGDLAQAPLKHEHSGPDGGAIKVDVYARMSDAELLAVATGAAPVPALGDGEDE